jgi:hypothetical protein
MPQMSQEKLEACFAYQFDSALDCLQEVYGTTGEKIFIRPIGEIDVNQIIHAVEKDEKEEASPLKFKIAEEKDTEIAQDEMKKSYVCSLKYAADVFNDILSKTDRLALGKIIKKIDNKLHYESPKQNVKE